MRIVVALGGNALLRRGQPPTVRTQRENIRAAAPALAALAGTHELVVTHGNGPQVGLLALPGAALPDVEPYPLDGLGAQTEGMVGYLVEQELGNCLPPPVPLATVVTTVLVDVGDPAFGEPTKYVGPGYDQARADALAAERGWTFRPEGSGWRRVVASPEPVRILQTRPVRWLLERGVVVICAGGGGVPTAFEPGSERLTGVEGVVDKDLAGELLARELRADLFVMATDVGGVYRGWGTPGQRRIEATTPRDLDPADFAAGSMGPKVRAAVRFVQHTGGRAVIGELGDLDAIVRGRAGTQVTPFRGHRRTCPPLRDAR